MKNNFFSLAMLVSLLAFCLCFTSCGPSAAEIAIRSAPSVEAVTGLRNKLIWLKGNAQSGGSYLIEIDTDEQVGGLFNSSLEFSYKDKSNITITLKGIGSNRTISSREVGTVLSIGSGVTLILDENITIKGLNTPVMNAFEAPKTGPLVSVFTEGKLIMNDGSTIIGNWNANDNGGGVYVAAGGTFIMKGGVITGNQVRTIRPNFAASSKDKMVFDASALSKGAGVYVSGESTFLVKAPSGTFTKTGGTITGYASDHDKSSNAVVKPDGSDAVDGNGHAVFFNGKEPKAIDTTIGPEYSFHFSNGIFSETQSEKTIQSDE